MKTRTKNARGTTGRPLASAILLATILAVPSILRAAELTPLSPECDKIRVEAMRAYWGAYSDAVLGARMKEILGSSTDQEKNLLMLAEVFSGRVSAEQIGESSLAGFDAIRSSGSCSADDRKSAEQFRALLPKGISALEKKAAEMKKGP
jgi:hypothetical protein